MKLEFQDTYTHAVDRGFPPDIAYLCFAPREAASSGELVDLAVHVLERHDLTKVVLLRPFRQGRLVHDLGAAKSLVSHDVAEGYAFIRCSDVGELEECLQAAEQGEESSVVHEYGKDIIVLLHQGHPSIEVLGRRDVVKRCAENLFLQHLG